MRIAASADLIDDREYAAPPELVFEADQGRALRALVRARQRRGVAVRDRCAPRWCDPIPASLAGGTALSIRGV
jgi:hypothetical protein